MSGKRYKRKWDSNSEIILQDLVNHSKSKIDIKNISELLRVDPEVIEERLERMYMRKSDKDEDDNINSTNKAKPKKSKVAKDKSSDKVTSEGKNSPAANAKPKAKATKGASVSVNKKRKSQSSSKVLDTVTPIVDIKPSMCMWPSEPKDGEKEILFCGREISIGESYCHEHCVRAYGKAYVSSKENPGA